MAIPALKGSKTYFADQDFPPISIKQSESKKERDVTAASAQTKPIKTVESEVQSYQREDAAVQTKNLQEDLDFTDDVDWKRLTTFLRDVEPKMVKELEKNLRSTLFKRYEAMRELDISVENSHSLKDASLPKEMQAKSVDWNSSGTTVAVACGFAEHSDWCTHKGFVYTWNVERRSLDPSKADVSLELDSCATTLVFHPSIPSFLAVGAVNGDVAVFNLALGEGNMLTADTKASKTVHKDPVTAVCWAQLASNQDRKLISTGSDGKIIVWGLPSRGKDLEPQRVLMVTVRSLPRSLRGKVPDSDREAGVTGLAFSRKESDVFVVSGETGGVFHCSMNSKDIVPTADISFGGMTATNPVVFGLRPHNGPVYCVRESPFHRNLFLSTSGDGSLRVYNVLKLDPVLSANLGGSFIYSASWSPARPLVVAAGTASGLIVLMDFSHSEAHPITTIEATKKSVLSVQFNPGRADLIASADSEGVVKIWKIGDRLVTQSSGEEEKLAEIAARTEE